MNDQRFLSVDIGTKRTGVAFLEREMGIAFPLDTLSHQTPKELVASLVKIIDERNIDMVILGLPLLPSGEEGEQASFVRSVGELLASSTSVQIFYLDERYTTQYIPDVDPDASSASQILNLYFEKYLTN